MISDIDVFEAALRNDFMTFLAKSFSQASGGDTFLPNWHHEAIAWELDRVRQSLNTRLIVTMPPRYLKSITISVAWVAWRLGVDPTLRFVCVSYSNALAEKHARDCRAIMQTDWYQRAFPNTQLKRGASAEMDFQTTRGGGRLSTSVGGTLTGRGGDIIIIDDPIKPEDANSETTRRRVLDWYSNTLISRLNDKSKGAMILVMQRLHEEDLAGHLLETSGWQHLSLPAISPEDTMIEVGQDRYHVFKEGTALHPSREGVERLEALRAELGSATYSAQYLQAPIPVEGLHVKRKWLRSYSGMPDKQPGDQVVQSWDTASKEGPFSDFSVCVTALIRKRDVYVLDVFRNKLTFPDLRRKVIDLGRQWEADTLLIEDAASGQQLIQTLQDEPPKDLPRPIACKPEGDKLSRFSAQTARIEAGEVFLPKVSGWRSEFERELLGFPNVKHDDQVDALTQVLSWRQPKRRGVGAAPTLYIGFDGQPSANEFPAGGWA